MIYRNKIKFIATPKRAEALLIKMSELKPLWIEMPRLLLGPFYDDFGPERYISIEFVSDTDSRNRSISGYELINLYEEAGCLHEETSQVFIPG